MLLFAKDSVTKATATPSALQERDLESVHTNPYGGEIGETLVAL